MTLDKAMNNFNSGQFKIRMKKMAAQVNFFLYLNAFLSPKLFGAWKLAHTCPIKVLFTYLKCQLLNEASQVTTSSVLTRWHENAWPGFDKKANITTLLHKITILYTFGLTQISGVDKLVNHLIMWQKDGLVVDRNYRGKNAGGH